MAAVFVIEWAECQTILFYMSWQTAIFLFKLVTFSFLSSASIPYTSFRLPCFSLLPFILSPVWFYQMQKSTVALDPVA